MDKRLGLCRVRLLRGIQLAKRDINCSDPYVVLRMGKEKLKSSVKKTTLDPVWNEEFTLTILDPKLPIKLEVFDKDRLTGDDKMGYADVDIKPIMYTAQLGQLAVPDGTIIKKVQPNAENDLSKQSEVVWRGGNVVQLVTLRLRNVECGEIELELHWVNLPGAKAI